MAMPYTKKKVGTSQQILLFPDHYVNRSYRFLKDDSTATEEGGRKIIKAGTVYPANDATAVGIVFYDVDVTDGDSMGALLVHGFLNKNKLPAAISAEAQAVLPMVYSLPAE